jgi:hypothetical protein
VSGLWCKLLAVLPSQPAGELRAARWPGFRNVPGCESALNQDPLPKRDKVLRSFFEFPSGWGPHLEADSHSVLKFGTSAVMTSGLKRRSSPSCSRSLRDVKRPDPSCRSSAIDAKRCTWTHFSHLGLPSNLETLPGRGTRELSVQDCPRNFGA